MPRVDSNTLYGTLNLLILMTLRDESLHGLEIMRRIEACGDGHLRIEEGALYPALHRLEKEGLLDARWGTSDQNRRAKFYELTSQGRRRLERETALWVHHVRAVGSVLKIAWS